MMIAGPKKCPTGRRSEGVRLPLSEDEQRILQEIEEQFYEHDPAFARGVSSIYRPAVRSLKWSALGFVVGIVLLIAALSASVVLSFGGFLIMLASAFWFERSLRKMGRVGWNQLTSSIGGGHVSQRLGGASGRMRERFRRDKPEN